MREGPCRAAPRVRLVMAQHILQWVQGSHEHKVPEEAQHSPFLTLEGFLEVRVGPLLEGRPLGRCAREEDRPVGLLILGAEVLW
jgi:hypothetical protein